MNCCAQHTIVVEPSKRPRDRWRTNTTPTERGGRLAIGSLAEPLGAAGLVGAGSALAVVLYVIRIAAGADLLVTGAASVGFAGAALACTAMMALMTPGMDHGGHDHRGGR